MLTTFLPVLLTLLAAAAIARARKHAEKSRQYCEQLVRNIAEARRRRERWLKDHAYYKNPFDVDEYHKLWEIEIGAEEIAYLFFPKMIWRTRRVAYRSEQIDFAERERKDGL